jgi:anti-sigma factor (TIGR02949 family)
VQLLNRFTCEEAFRRLDDYLDRELRDEEMALVREHLETCAACTQEFAYEASVLTEVRRKIQRVDVPADLVERLARQLREAEQARRNDGGSG